MTRGVWSSGSLSRWITAAVALGTVAVFAVGLDACGGRLSEAEYYERASDAVEGVATASVELSKAADEASNGIQFLLVVKTAANRTTKAARELKHLNPPKSEEESNEHLIDALLAYKKVMQKAIRAARKEDREKFAEIRPELDINSPEVRTIRQAAARFRLGAGE